MELEASIEESDVIAEIAWCYMTKALPPVVRAGPATRCGRLLPSMFAELEADAARLPEHKPV